MDYLYGFLLLGSIYSICLNLFTKCNNYKSVIIIKLIPFMSAVVGLLLSFKYFNIL